MIAWNKEGFKYGICNSPPIGQTYSMLCLANNTCIKDNFGFMVDKFSKLYKRKVIKGLQLIYIYKFYVHHYTQYME